MADGGLLDPFVGQGDVLFGESLLDAAGELAHKAGHFAKEENLVFVVSDVELPSHYFGQFQLHILQVLPDNVYLHHVLEHYQLAVMAGHSLYLQVILAVNEIADPAEQQPHVLRQSHPLGLHQQKPYLLVAQIKQSRKLPPLPVDHLIHLFVHHAHHLEHLLQLVPVGLAVDRVPDNQIFHEVLANPSPHLLHLPQRLPLLLHLQSDWLDREQGAEGEEALLELEHAEEGVLDVLDFVIDVVDLFLDVLRLLEVFDGVHQLKLFVD